MLWTPSNHGAIYVPAAGGGGSWTTVLTVTPNVPGNDSGNNGYTFVQVIPLSALSATGGTQIRVTINGPASGVEGLSLSGLYVGNGGGGDAYDFGDTPVQLLSGGSGNIDVASGATLVLDAANFVKDGTNPIVFAMQLDDASNDNIWKQGGANPGSYSSWYKSGADAATQNKTGYTDNSAASWLLLINKIELLI